MSRPLAAVVALAGALAVPPHPIATPLAAAVAWALGLLGVRVWRWSGLPELLPPAAKPWPRRLLQPVLWFTIGSGMGLLILGVLRLLIEPALPAIGIRIAAAGALPVWRRALIVYVAAVGEELVFRLILFSAVAGLAARLFPARAPLPRPLAVWTANVIAALAFAAVHLPSWAAAGPSSATLAVAVIALNLAPGLLLGYVFAKRGIAAAIWAHAGGDCVIQFLGPLTRAY